MITGTCQCTSGKGTASEQAVKHPATLYVKKPRYTVFCKRHMKEGGKTVDKTLRGKSKRQLSGATYHSGDMGAEINETPRQTNQRGTGRGEMPLPGAHKPSNVGLGWAGGGCIQEESFAQFSSALVNSE